MGEGKNKLSIEEKIQQKQEKINKIQTRIKEDQKRVNVLVKEIEELESLEIKGLIKELNIPYYEVKKKLKELGQLKDEP